MADLGKLALEIAADTKGFQGSLNSASLQAQGFASAVTGSMASATAAMTALAANPVGATIVALGVAVTAAAAAFSVLQKALFDTMAEADRQFELQRQLNVSAEAVGGLLFQAESAGVTFEELSGSLALLQNRLSQAARGSGEAEASLNRIGLTSQELSGLGMDETLARIADGLQEAYARGDGLSASFDLLTRRGMALDRVLRGGSQAMASFRQQATELGYALDEEQVQRLHELSKAWKQLTVMVGEFVENLKEVVATSDLVQTWFRGLIVMTGSLLTGKPVDKFWEDLQKRIKDRAALNAANEGLERMMRDAKALSDEMEKLRDRAAHAGLDEFARSMARLREMGATPGQMWEASRLEAIGRHRQAVADMTKEYERLRTAIASAAGAQTEFAAASPMATFQARSQDLSRDMQLYTDLLARGRITQEMWNRAHEEYLSRVRELNREQADAMRGFELQARQIDQMRRLAPLLDNAGSAFDRLQQQARDAWELMIMGVLTAEQFDRAMTGLGAQFQQLNAQAQQARLAGAVEAGSVEAVSLVNRIVNEQSGRAVNVQERMAQMQQEQLIVQKEQRRLGQELVDLARHGGLSIAELN